MREENRDFVNLIKKKKCFCGILVEIDWNVVELGVSAVILINVEKKNLSTFVNIDVFFFEI